MSLLETLLAAAALALVFLRRSDRRVALPVFKTPEARGPYPVGTTILHLVDTSRPETQTPDAADSRELLLQIWYPAESSGDDRYAYVPFAETYLQQLSEAYGIPSFLLSHLKSIKSHAAYDASVSARQSSYPVILFSHGLGTGRTFYTGLFEELASEGYIVAAMDHTYSALATVFPDGRCAALKTNADDFTQDQARALEEIWYEDVQFALESLGDLNEPGGGRGLLAGKMDLDRIGMFGHSFGGAVSLKAYLQDDRIKAAVNMDGSVYSQPGGRPPSRFCC